MPPRSTQRADEPVPVRSLAVPAARPRPPPTAQPHAFREPSSRAPGSASLGEGVRTPTRAPSTSRRDGRPLGWDPIIYTALSCNLPKAITRVDAHTAPGHIYDECAQCAAGGREGGAGSRSVNRPRQTRSHTPPHSAPRSAP
eukprot:scaffold47928_cov49-Phaeocystis_antarctica.AAC.3